MNEATPTAATTVHKDIEWVTKAVHGYLNGMVEDRWCEHGKVGCGLCFQPGSLLRLGSILGGIDSLRDAHLDLAQAMATDILRKLDDLSTYGGEIDTGVPANLISLADDGTYGGFTLLWYRAFNWTEFAHEKKWGDMTPTDCQELLNEHKILRMEPRQWLHRPDLRQCGFRADNSPRPLFAYRFCMNGGLLYQGPGADETYTISLSSHLWSIHT